MSPKSGPALSTRPSRHARMKGVSSTPETPQSSPKVVNFRLPPALAQEARVKSVQDAESLQSFYETCTRAWLAGLIDPAELRAQLPQ